MREITFNLPYPISISVNNIWKRSKQGMYLNHRAKKYRDEVYYLTRNIETFDQKDLEIELKMYPPDKRTRDIDNILKSIFDAIQYAKIINSDYQIRKATIERFDPVCRPVRPQEVHSVTKQLQLQPRRQHFAPTGVARRFQERQRNGPCGPRNVRNTDEEKDVSQ